MPKYEVVTKFTTHVTLLIEAESRQEALQRAQLQMGLMCGKGTKADKETVVRNLHFNTVTAEPVSYNGKRKYHTLVIPMGIPGLEPLGGKEATWKDVASCLCISCTGGSAHEAVFKNSRSNHDMIPHENCSYLK